MFKRLLAWSGIIPTVAALCCLVALSGYQRSLAGKQYDKGLATCRVAGSYLSILGQSGESTIFLSNLGRHSAPADMVTRTVGIQRWLNGRVIYYKMLDFSPTVSAVDPYRIQHTLTLRHSVIRWLLWTIAALPLVFRPVRREWRNIAVHVAQLARPGAVRRRGFPVGWLNDGGDDPLGGT